VFFLVTQLIYELHCIVVICLKKLLTLCLQETTYIKKGWLLKQIADKVHDIHGVS